MQRVRNYAPPQRGIYLPVPEAILADDSRGALNFRASPPHRELYRFSLRLNAYAEHRERRGHSDERDLSENAAIITHEYY